MSDRFGVYIHVPFCSTRCGYCDFNTYTPTEVETSHQTYLEALEQELELAAPASRPPTPSSSAAAPRACSARTGWAGS